jgi:2-haloacid dehalogenase
VNFEAITFDAFGTLFDLNALRVRTRSAASHEGDELFAAFKTRLIPWSWHATTSGNYKPFPELAALALQGAAREAGFRLERSRADWIVEGMKELPPFEDVQPALERLRAARIRLTVTTNGTPEGIQDVVENAGLDGYFEELLAAHTVGRFKPAPEVYALAPEALGIPADRILFVSGHEWDIAGAAQAGHPTAWIARGEPLAPTLGIEPDLVCEDFRELADRLAR